MYAYVCMHALRMQQEVIVNERVSVDCCNVVRTGKSLFMFKSLWLSLKCNISPF